MDDDSELRDIFLRFINHLTAAILGYIQGYFSTPATSAAPSSSDTGRSYSGSYSGPSALDTVLSGLAVLAFALFFINTVLPLLAGTGTGRSGRGDEEADLLPLDMRQELVNLLSEQVQWAADNGS